MRLAAAAAAAPGNKSLTGLQHATLIMAGSMNKKPRHAQRRDLTGVLAYAVSSFVLRSHHGDVHFICMAQ